jgi:hypothetical protein
VCVFVLHAGLYGPLLTQFAISAVAAPRASGHDQVVGPHPVAALPVEESRKDQR